FFFQAEDGIRDYKVTGVQTCALPIFRPRRLRLRWLILDRAHSLRRSLRFLHWRSALGRLCLLNHRLGWLTGCLLHRFLAGLVNRSEERRVGKECSYRRSAWQQNKKTM